ncbi:MAG: SusE domain-containing protein [Bacteroidetes bacterium]|nr:SusE domain-containing protein [Bacteroidota bacterium]
MKTIVNKLMLLAAGLMITLSCTTDIDRVTYLGAGAPGVVLKVSSTSNLVLLKANESYTSLLFQWTNPNYQFSNGPSTQDVFYTIQIVQDTVGSDFNSPKMATVAITNDVTHPFTVKDLNNALALLELPDETPHHFQFRVKATLAGGNEPIYSNVVKIVITTYLDVVYPVPANLYIVGDATPAGWNNDVAHLVPSQQLTKVKPYLYQINSLALTQNQFLFVPVAGDWTHKYAFDAPGSTNNPMGDAFKPDANSNFQAPAAGNYMIQVNFKTGKYSMTKL